MAKDARGDFYPVPMIDQDTRPGTVTRLIIFILILIVSAVVFGLFRERFGDPFLLGMLGVLAMIGVGFLFATAIGFIQIAPRSTGDELSKAFVDSMAQGLVVTDAKNRIIYANRAYAEMTGAASAADIRTVESLLSDAPERENSFANAGPRVDKPGWQLAVAHHCVLLSCLISLAILPSWPHFRGCRCLIFSIALAETDMAPPFSGFWLRWPRLWLCCSS